MDWKTLGNFVLLVGMFVTLVTMFNQVNVRLDMLQAEMNRRFDNLQAENQRQHDSMQEILRLFEGRISRLEGQEGIQPEEAE